jgi:hypothetical protein
VGEEELRRCRKAGLAQGNNEAVAPEFEGDEMVGYLL